MSETAAKDPAGRTGGVELRGVQLDLLGRLARGRNNDVPPGGRSFGICRESSAKVRATHRFLES